MFDFAKRLEMATFSSIMPNWVLFQENRVLLSLDIVQEKSTERRFLSDKTTFINW